LLSSITFGIRFLSGSGSSGGAVPKGIGGGTFERPFSVEKRGLRVVQNSSGSIEEAHQNKA
jgi:hypothetical protein